MPVILTGFAIAGLLCGLIMLRKTGILGLGLLTLFAGICFGPAFKTVASLTSDRVMIVAIFGFYVFARQSSFFRCKPVQNIDLLGAALLVWLLISALSHDWRIDSAQPLKNYVFYYALPAAMYWIARETPLSEKNMRIVLFSMLLFGVYLALTAVAEWRQIAPVVFPRYIASLEHPEFLGRGRGPLLNPAGNGFLLATCLSAAALSWYHVQIRGKTLVAIVLPVILAGLFATLTRCAWLGGMLVLGVLGLTVIPKLWRGRIALVGLVALSCVLVANKDRLNNFKRDRFVTAAEMSKSASLRPMLADVAWGIFQDHPFTGVGLGQYKQHSALYHTRETDFARPYVQHNVILSLLTEAGLIGTLLYVTLLLAWAKVAWELWRNQHAPLVIRHLGVLLASLLVAYFANGMFQDLTIIHMVHVVLAYVAGLAVGQHQLYGGRAHATSEATFNPAFDRRSLAV